jgi:threonylcarbamoyladenosine tRNA methylthiotransferase MtaB
MPATVALETLGCKINQYESSHFLEVLEEAGYQVVSFRDPADLYIVHGCSVTSNAAYQSRQLLRRAQRMNPRATVALVGCEAHVEQDRIASEQLATHILGNTEKLHLINWLARPGRFDAPCRAVGNPREEATLEPLPVHRMHLGRSRAFLKIQDGCDAFCSYCIVPHTRGRSRSLPSSEVRGQLNRFLSLGYSEVVLSGIHLGQWGKDLAPRQSLASLLQEIGEGALPTRLRLSSLEPMEWTSELLSSIAHAPWICPHFHVPLQNGDPDILKGMARPYTPGQYRDVVHELRLRFPDAALGADVMVGFPGETDKQFQNTYNLIKELPLTYLHVFPFSPRPGTAAAHMPGRITGQALKQRSKALRDLSLGKRIAFESSFVGRHLEILTESEERPGVWKGTSANYLKVLFQDLTGVPAVRLARVRISEWTKHGLMGKTLE